MSETTTFAPDVDNIEAVKSQARHLAKNSLWGSSLKEQLESFVDGFTEAYLAGEEDNFYEYKNLNANDMDEIKLEAFKIGKARASVFLRSQNIPWGTSSLSYYGGEDSPFGEQIRALNNPFEDGETVNLPEGTVYLNSKNQSVVTKRATTVKIGGAFKGSVSGSVWKRFYHAPSISYTSGGEYRSTSITIALLLANNCVIEEAEINGMTGGLRASDFLAK